MYSTQIKLSVVCPALLVCAGLLSSCATSAPTTSPSGQIIEQVRIADVQADDALPLLSSEQEIPTANTVESEAVRWGGTITRVENLTKQRTQLEIVARPLRSNGRPVHNDSSDGRFVAIVDEFLDPEIVEPGRDITIVGTLVARQSGTIGETEYVFPVVAAQTTQYWKQQVVVRQRQFPHWNTYSRRHADPFWDLWLRHRRPTVFPLR